MNSTTFFAPPKSTSRLPVTLLRAEGVALFAAATALYFASGYLWWVFLLFLLAPDLSMLGYLGGPRMGSYVYNAVHTLVVPLALTLVGWWLGWAWAVPVGLIWLAHIGMDRAAGYGLKYPDAFKHTHLDNL